MKMIVVVLLFLSTLRPFTSIRLEGNGYTNILVVINPAVPENDNIINQIKCTSLNNLENNGTFDGRPLKFERRKAIGTEFWRKNTVGMIINGSEYLFQALDNKVFFKEVKILVPTTWTTGKYDKASTENFSKGRIRIDQPHPAFGDDPYTQQTRGCGSEGEYIHFTPNFLLNDNLLKGYGPRGRVFVHEWAHLRWGVFHEYNQKEPFYLSDGQRLPTSCTNKISGQVHTMNKNSQPCEIDAGGKPPSNYEFIPDAVQKANASIMYMPSLDSVKAFCQEDDHNFEAPNDQNKKCGKATRTVIFEDSVDKDMLRNLKPLPSQPILPTFKLIQRGPRVVCLVLDISGSMSGRRIKLQQHAATVFISQIIDEQQFVALVSFSSNAQILSPLTLIDGDTSRNNLINKLPTSARGSTYICKGLRKAFEVLQTDEDKTIGDEIILLTDGMASAPVQDCLKEVVESGAVVNTIALGPNADTVLSSMANQTDGKFIVAEESVLSNQLVDAFSSLTTLDGNPIIQPIQLESTGRKVDDWFNGTVPVDRTVGNHTTFTLIYESNTPTVYLNSPSGLIYDQQNSTDIANIITLTVPGTAEPGDWKYSFLNKQTAAQQMSLTVMSRAAREDVHPIIVTARMNQQTSDGTKPMVVFAAVSQNYNPVLGASVWAYLESDTGSSEKLHLLDNGAGADAFKDDGVYSRYFTMLKRGRYSLKVKVKNQHEGLSFSPCTYTGALYVLGYIVKGKVELNPPKPPVNVQPVDVGNFSRSVTGDSFVVEEDATSNFPPNKITDLSAEIQEDTVLLNWTAPGEDYDLGTAQSYEIRWSEDLKTLRDDFTSANLFNTSTLLPKESGSAEQHTFQPNSTMKNSTTLFFAIRSMDQQSIKSEVSNVARATKFIPSPRPPPISNPGLNLTAIIVSVCVVITVPCFIIVVITGALKRKRHTNTNDTSPN